MLSRMEFSILKEMRTKKTQPEKNNKVKNNGGGIARKNHKL